VKCVFARNCRKFPSELSRSTVLRITGIHEVTKVRPIDLLLGKKRLIKRLVLIEENQDERGARLQHAAQKLLAGLAKQMDIEVDICRSDGTA
jgi:hypothetical protein